MGANTYIGNCPKTLWSEVLLKRVGFPMPSFFGYMVWSFGILVPIFLVYTFIFLV